ncbi:LamG-like jellyroll fold domain-containing protein [Lapillicoccus sp.]|uniref:LamG-like jellyroll fold domain-containing protein n=1 Tax=Lapillicoccus sp. TaxID=1909287 RepID=UPI0025DE63E7|nr:LamG-like jellyroll fold domain-containing protein [Lapillicoccus sp.]
MSELQEQVGPARQVRRRGFLAAAGATAGVGAVSLVGAPGAAAAPGDTVTTAGGRGFARTSARFALAVLADTQYLFDADSADPAPLTETFRYLVQERAEVNIAFMTHLGDVTEHGSEDEITRASRTFRAIDGKLPYSVLVGNHDVDGSTDDQRGDTAYLRAFGPQRFAGTSGFGGASPDGYNSFHVMTAGNRDWLVLALDWRASDEGLAWVQTVLDAHRTLPTVLTTHELAGADDQGKASLSEYGQRLWDSVIRGNDQIFLTLNGHYWPPGRTVLTNDADHDVHVHITSYQDRYYGGGGTIRLYAFDLDRDAIDVSTFSPWFLSHPEWQRTELDSETLELTSDVDRFSLSIDFAARFSGFAPVPEPPSRPATAVVSRDTLAYWRFDASAFGGAGTDGAPVADGALVRDLSGHGNDLHVQRLHGGDASVLRWSMDHMSGQPAHASLRFDGGQSPDRGAVLQTAAGVPITRASVKAGYTIELFLKLPDPFVGAHGFMGIFSWVDRAGDAGKHNGYSPLEPTCSLNLSGERFLQYVVYPEVQNASPTSWSHVLPVGRWFHVAIVNDAKATTVYVDGSRIVRNPSQPSTGIALIGKPFALGGSSFDEVFGQGFYGSLGDVRISRRALRPAELMRVWV